MDNGIITEKLSGIYQIKNLINGKLYIGSALYIKKRWSTHIKRLKENIHHSLYLQSSYNKYGIDNFEFSVIELCAPEIMIAKEQYYIDKYKTASRVYGYNVCPKAGSCLGSKHSESAIAKKKLKTKINSSKADKKVYVFAHNDHGKVELNKYDFADQFGINRNSLNNLVAGRVKRLQSGWCLDFVKQRDAPVNKKVEVSTDDIIKDYESGATLIFLAQKYGLHFKTIADRLSRNGIKTRGVYETNIVRRNKIDKNSFISDYDSGVGVSKLADKYGVSGITARQMLKQSGVPIRDQSQTQKLKIRLSVDQKEIVAKYSQGVSAQIIARQYGINNNTVLSILKENNVILRTQSEAARQRTLKKLGDALEEIITDYINGESAPKLAKKHKVSHATITSVLMWKGVKTRTYLEAQFLRRKVNRPHIAA